MGIPFRRRSEDIPRYLGIDYGAKRIGLALSNPEGTIASPLGVIHRRGDLRAQARAVIAAGEAYDIDAYVLGIPWNMDGTEGEQAKRTRSFGSLLGKESGKSVAEWDERLSSRAADEFLSAGALTNKQRKARRDALAAQIILQGFLDAGEKLPPGGEAPR